MHDSRSDEIEVQGVEPGDAEAAVDTLAFLLRVLGEHGFDTVNTKAKQSRSNLEAWARHVLIGSDPPGTASLASSDRERNWAGLSRFVSEKRRDEVEYVIRSSSDLRETLWTFIQGMARAIPADMSSDQAISGQLEKLRSCLNSNDTSELRRIASSSIEVIDQQIAERIERNQLQVVALADQVNKVSDELVEAREMLERDALTRIYNRGAFDEYITKMTHLGMLSGQPSTLYLIDVDDFKWVNDRSGHPAGDEILKEVAGCLVAGFGRRGDFVARYGGDEFAVIVKSEGDVTDLEMAEHALQRVRDLSVPVGDEDIRVTLSIGFSRLRCGEGSRDWLARADRALYKAKEAGRDRVVLETELTEEAS